MFEHILLLKGKKCKENAFVKCYTLRRMKLITAAIQDLFLTITVLPSVIFGSSFIHRCRPLFHKSSFLSALLYFRYQTRAYLTFHGSISETFYKVVAGKFRENTFNFLATSVSLGSTDQNIVYRVLNRTNLCTFEKFCCETQQTPLYDGFLISSISLWLRG